MLVEKRLGRASEKAVFQVGAFVAVQGGGGAGGRKWLGSGDTSKVKRAVFPTG